MFYITFAPPSARTVATTNGAPPRLRFAGTGSEFLRITKAFIPGKFEELSVTLGAPLNKSDTRIEQQGLVVNSTPQKYDHLVISPVLKGTSTDGAFNADSQGNLVLDLQVRDYFFSIADDVGPEQAIV